MALAPIVAVYGLVKSYGPLRVVDAVSFELRPGEILALLGPNGAGKTTVLKCLLGLARPNAGRIELGGLDLAGDGARARALLGYVPQRNDLGDELTGRELLAFVSRLRRLTPGDAAHAADQAGAADLLDQPLATLSGGQLQRVILAQALLGNPPLLVLDEPTVSLDPVAQHEYVGLLAKQRDHGKAILLSSHLLSEVERLADRALVLDRGRPVALWAREAWEECGLEQLFLSAVRGVPGETGVGAAAVAGPRAPRPPLALAPRAGEHGSHGPVR